MLIHIRCSDTSPVLYKLLECLMCLSFEFVFDSCDSRFWCYATVAFI